jgi:hypothetical protein
VVGKGRVFRGARPEADALPERTWWKATSRSKQREAVPGAGAGLIGRRGASFFGWAERQFPAHTAPPMCGDRDARVGKRAWHRVHEETSLLKPSLVVRSPIRGGEHPRASGSSVAVLCKIPLEGLSEARLLPWGLCDSRLGVGCSPGATSPLPAGVRDPRFLDSARVVWRRAATPSSTPSWSRCRSFRPTKNAPQACFWLVLHHVPASNWLRTTNPIATGSQ